MRNLSVVATTALLCLAPVLPAQKPRTDDSQQTALESLRQVQAALHAAEKAQLTLLKNPRNKAARVSLDLAVEALITARKALRDQVAGRRAGPAGASSLPVASKPRSAPKKYPRPNSMEIELSIERGLKWLYSHQDQNGRWDNDRFFKHDQAGSQKDGPGSAVHDVGATGLALLAFLGAGNTTTTGPYKETVLKAARWLRNQQGPNGLFGTPASHDFIYDHAIASFAMCEAYGISKDMRLKKAAQMGINYLESHRNPYACWRYQPRDNDNDSSVTGWCLRAYRSASDFGLQVNRQALKITANFLDELTDPASGRLGYTKRGEGSSRHPGDHATRFPIESGESLTALGLASRFLLKQSPDRQPVMRLAADRLLAKLPDATNAGAVDHYYWFHGTTAMMSMGGNHWQQWSRAAAATLLGMQRKDGHLLGSWDSSGVWGRDGGRVYSTALMLVSMQTICRYIRLRRDK